MKDFQVGLITISITVVGMPIGWLNFFPKQIIFVF